jgi:hypothetical protein
VFKKRLLLSRFKRIENRIKAMRNAPRSVILVGYLPGMVYSGLVRHPFGDEGRKGFFSEMERGFDSREVQGRKSGTVWKRGRYGDQRLL